MERRIDFVLYCQIEPEDVEAGSWARTTPRSLYSIKEIFWAPVPNYNKNVETLFVRSSNDCVVNWS